MAGELQADQFLPELAKIFDFELIAPPVAPQTPIVKPDTPTAPVQPKDKWSLILTAAIASLILLLWLLKKRRAR
jgi:hypothetical protein